MRHEEESTSAVAINTPDEAQQTAVIATAENELVVAAKNIQAVENLLTQRLIQVKTVIRVPRVKI